MDHLDDKESKAIRAASIYLEEKGAKILDTGYTCEAGTIDLVFTEDDALVFALVKASSGNALPDERLTANDRVRLEMIAFDYLASHDLPNSRVRFDTISLAGEGRMLLCHHRNALALAHEPFINRTAEARRVIGKGGPQQRAKKGRGRER